MAKKGINVKVKTVKVIDALEAVLKQRKKDHELYEKDCEAYKKATENADKKVLAFIKTGKATVKEVSSTNRWRSDNDKGFHAFTVTVLIAECYRRKSRSTTRPPQFLSGERVHRLRNG